MELTISFKNLDSDDQIKAYTEKRSEKLKKYFDGKISLTWNFSTEKSHFIAHCHLVGNHMDFFGESTEETLTASVDIAIDKIERQIKKFKEKVTAHH